MKYRYVIEFETTGEIPAADLATVQASMEAQLESLADCDPSHPYRNVSSSCTAQWTFEEFVATRERREDIGAAVMEELYDADGKPCVKPGYLYVGKWFIEIEPDGTYCLTFGNESLLLESLALAERSLFDTLF